MNTTTFPRIDQNQVRRHLELLGYQENEKIFLRFFYPSDDPRKKSDKGRKSNRLNWQEMENYQQLGRGTYFVINGGGHKNNDVKFGRAVFIEHDHLNKETQKELWRALGLPQPTFQIDTGGKSIHSYWVLTKPITVNQWCELQKDLLEYTDGDRSIKNPARVMRLAGAWHIKICEGKAVYNQSIIISASEQKYIYEELRATIPLSNGGMGNGKVQDSSNKNKIPNSEFRPACGTSEATSPNSEIPVPVPVPLEKCLAIASRELLASGLGEGQRNSGGAKLARDLIGTYQYLLSIGQSVDGNPRQLLSDYAKRCTPSLDEREVESIWASAYSSNPTPSCTPSGVDTCVRAWYLKELRMERWDPADVPSAKECAPRENGEFRSHNSKANGHKNKIPNSEFRTPNSTVTGDSKGNSDSSNQEQMGISETVTAVTSILRRGLTDYEEQVQLDQIEAHSVMSKNAFSQLVKSIQCQLDEIQPEDKNRFNQLLEWHDAKIDFERIFPQDLAYGLTHDGEILNIDPVMLVQYLLPTCLSLVGKRASLNVESHCVPAIIWNCIVAESGTGKSRAENVILDPLKKWQIEERRRFEQQHEDYEKQKRNLAKDAEEPPLPNPERKYLFQVGTIQSVMRRLAEQNENGSIWSRDELAGLLKSLGQFSKRGSDNEDLECLLELWDGKAAFVERMDKIKNSYVAQSTCLSIAGGIQPKAFRQAFKDPDDPQGLQARFLYAVPQELPMKRVRGYCVLSYLLPILYEQLQKCPQGEINLSPEASALYTELVAKIGKQAKKSPNAAIRAWMRKLPSHLLRLAFCLHVIEWAYGHKDDDFFTLTVETLKRAAELATYYQNSFQVIQEKASESDSVSSILIKIYDLALTKPEGISPRDAYRHVKVIARRAKELGRKVGAYAIELLSQLAQMGKGIIHKEGRLYRFIADLNGIGEEIAVEKNQGEGNEKEFSPEYSNNSEVDMRGNISSSQVVNKIPNSKSVTGVTEVINQAEKELELSPTKKVSPVTEEVSIENTGIENLESSSQNTAMENRESSSQNTTMENQESSSQNTTMENREFSSQNTAMENRESSSQNMAMENREFSSQNIGIENRESSSQNTGIENRESLIENTEETEETSTDLNSDSNLRSTSHLEMSETEDELEVVNSESIMDSEQVEESELNSTSIPSLAELKAMLMACESLAQLNALKKKHGKGIKDAYASLNSSEQLHIDGLEATAVSHNIYKYTGSLIEANGQSLEPGMLVYIDPKLGNQNANIVPVWLMRGLELGWRQAVLVSKDCLRLIEKAISNDDFLPFST